MSFQSRSPPPLVHPRPSHISQPPPEPTTSSPSTTYSGRPSGEYARPSFEASSRPSGDSYMRFSSPPVNAAQQGSAGAYGFGGIPNPNTFSTMGTGGATTGAQPYLTSVGHSGPGNPASGYGAGAYAAPSPGLHGNPGVAAAGSPSSGYMNPMGMNMGGFGAFAPGAGGQWPMGMNDATAQMGMQFGKSAVAAGQDYVEKNFSRYLPLPLVKTCFSVTNSYVLRKLRLVLFPWRHKPWSRQAIRSNRMQQDPHHGAAGEPSNGASGQDGWMPPRDDINAPDLYIPAMALVTYTLLCGLASGLQNRFHPEVLGYSLSKALGVVITEFLVIRLGCYLLDVRGTGASGVELIGYGGYKFVGIIVTVIASFLNWGKIFYSAVFFYTFCANAFFLLRSLKYVLLPDSSNSSSVATISHSQRSKRVQFLFVIAMAQILFMGLLVRV
ncbi:Protein transport protein yif1 [Naganishia albida]|nr:Protein transport protein yif1 [Naganishia albida]